MQIEELEKLKFAVAALLRADRKSKAFCAEMAVRQSEWLRKGWTRAAVERDAAEAYAREQAKKVFGLEEPSGGGPG